MSSLAFTRSSRPNWATTSTKRKGACGGEKLPPGIYLELGETLGGPRTRSGYSYDSRGLAKAALASGQFPLGGGAARGPQQQVHPWPLSVSSDEDVTLQNSDLTKLHLFRPPPTRCYLALSEAVGYYLQPPVCCCLSVDTLVSDALMLPL